MSAITVTIDGEIEGLTERLRRLSEFDRRGVLNAIGESLRTSTEERFQSERDPEGEKWVQSVRARDNGGKTLTVTTKLKTSIKVTVNNSGLAVGTNDIRAATHQLGDTRIIRAKNKKSLAFYVGGELRMVKQVTVHIPARPFLGISDDDKRDIMDMLEEVAGEES